MLRCIKSIFMNKVSRYSKTDTKYKKMAIGIDTSKWKPRKLNGTPAGRQSIVIGFGILSLGVLCGTFYQLSGFTKNYRETFTVLYKDPIEEIERKVMIASGLPNRSGDKIRELLEEDARPDLPNK